MTIRAHPPALRGARPVRGARSVTVAQLRPKIALPVAMKH
jgi:hypothetical protein